MSDARTRRVLQSIAIRPVDHRRTMALAAGALAVAALTLAVRYGGLAGFALLIALAAVSAATALWFRLGAAERSSAALALTVAELTTRLDLLSVTVPPAPSVTTPAESTEEAAVIEVAPSAVNIETPTVVASSTEAESDLAGPQVGTGAFVVAEVAPDLSANPSVTESDDSHLRDQGVATTVEAVADVLAGESSELGHAEEGNTLSAATPGEETLAVSEPETERELDGDDHPKIEDSSLIALVPTLEAMPAFTLTGLNGATVTGAALFGAPAVVVFWRPGCRHCQRLTPELVAWESLQGPRLIVFAACDGPTAFRAGLPGLVILDPGFTVGQAIGAPGTPAALPLDAAGRPSGPVVAGASAVTTLLLDSMREWASAEIEVEPMPQLSEISVETSDVSATDLDTAMSTDADAGTVQTANPFQVAPPTVLLRRVEEIPTDNIESAPDWDAESVVRRAG